MGGLQKKISGRLRLPKPHHCVSPEERKILSVPAAVGVPGCLCIARPGQRLKPSIRVGEEDPLIRRIYGYRAVYLPDWAEASIFRNARLLGSWDAQGHSSDAWTESPMQAIVGEDGCPAFTATMQFLTMRRWGMSFAGASCSMARRGPTSGASPPR